MNPQLIIFLSLIGIGICSYFLNKGFGDLASAELKQAKDELSKGIDLIQESTADLKKRTDLLLRATYYTQELTQNINQIWFRVSLKNEIDIAKIHPFKIVIDMYPALDVKTKFRNRFLIKSKEFYINNTQGKRLLPYYYTKIDSTLKGELLSKSIGFRNPVINAIVAPLTLPNQAELSIQDLHKKPFIVFLPESIIKIADKIQLYVNGWCILDEQVDSVGWTQEPQNKILDNIGDVSDLKRSSRKDGVPYSLWTINLYDRLPNKIDGIPYNETPAMVSDNYQTE
jgi:hypothetical protein